MFSHVSVLIRFEYGWSHCCVVAPLKHLLVGEEGHSGPVQEIHARKGVSRKSRAERCWLAAEAPDRTRQVGKGSAGLNNRVTWAFCMEQVDCSGEASVAMIHAVTFSKPGSTGFLFHYTCRVSSIIEGGQGRSLKQKWRSTAYRVKP